MQMFSLLLQILARKPLEEKKAVVWVYRGNLGDKEVPWGKKLEEAEYFKEEREVGFISRTSKKKDKDSEEAA